MGKIDSYKIARVHPNGQLSLGRQWGGRDVRVEFVSESEVRIVSGSFLPDHQKPFYTPEAIARLEAFSIWEEASPPAATDMNDFKASIAKKKAKKNKVPRK